MKTYLSYFGTIVGVLFGSYFGIVRDLVGSIICAVLVLFCMLWFSFSWEQMKQQSKDKERRIKSSRNGKKSMKNIILNGSKKFRQKSQSWELSTQALIRVSYITKC